MRKMKSNRSLISNSNPYYLVPFARWQMPRPSSRRDLGIEFEPTGRAKPCSLGYEQHGRAEPTVKIWGDEDRGTLVTPAYAWDNEITISTNQAAGTFSTTIDIPDMDKIYYFRVVANNAGGAVVSRQLGVVLPNAPVGVANLQGRWSFDGENANDLSGKHGMEPPKNYNPAIFCLACGWTHQITLITQTSNAVTQWRDKSGNNNHANQATAANQPTLLQVACYSTEAMMASI